MSEPILVAHNLRKTYGDHEAVKGIDLAVARGEVFGLLGPNGAGKSTTISMLTGILEPTGGQIVIDGLELARNTSAAKRKIGLVPQDLALYPTLSARQNLNFFGRIYGLGGAELRARVDQMLDMVGLSERAGDAIQTYSGGMKRRINIAAGLLHRPDVLFLDEPTVGVDPQSRNAIFESVEALNRQGMTVIYTTHYMEEAQRLCHRVAIVDLGQIIALDTPSALIRSLGGGIIVVGLEEGCADQVLQPVGALPGVKGVSRTDGKIKVETQRLQEALIGILAYTNQQDVRITSLEQWEPNLESVFLHLTGKKLRQ